ncbi:MAG: ABC transporter ATP-binding protein [Chloroflexota bacterium]
MSKLTLEQVAKVYGAGESAVTALDGVSLSVKAGELVAIVGPSGSGKTTLLAIAGALLRPTQGRVTLNDEDITTLSAAAQARVRRERIGFVLQASNLVPYLTGRDQLLLMAELSGRRDKAARARADQLLESFGLTRRAHHYPESLSGGERQRVAIARALMNDPDILLADEPTSNLDSARGREVIQMLAREVKARGKAACLVTHDERLLDLCDRVARIADGRLCESGA